MAENDTKKLLHPLLIAPSDPSIPSPLLAEFRKRNRNYNYKSVSRKNLDKYYEEGWEYDRKLKKKTRIKQKKDFDEQLENEVWCLFYKMGYLEMNEGRHFKVQYERKGSIVDEKQVDVFAKDDETVVFVECKASEKIKQRRLQNDLDAFANKKTYFANTVKKHYGPNFKPKILWLFVTDNIIWSRSDKTRAKAEKIRVITEREFRYFKRIVDHLGPAAKYQFLAEFFEGQSIPELKNIKVPAIRGKLGGKPFFCFVTTPMQLLKIAFVNHRALDDPQGIPTYQRLIQKARLKNIGNFLEEGGYFPTNFLINFNRNVRFDVSQKDDENGIRYGYLYLPDKYKSAWIIDGQHRLYAYSGLDDELLRQNIMVLAFEKLPRFQEANLFVTINHEQKSVPRSLLDDLEGDLKWGSDKPGERIGAIIAKLLQMLNSDLGEPFFNRITAQGIPSTDVTCLTVPEIKKGIKKAGLIGKSIFGGNVYELGPLCDETDEKSLTRAKETLNIYFRLMQESNIERWDKGRAGHLCTNFGVNGYLLLRGSLIKYMEQKKSLDAKELTEIDLIAEIEEYLKPALIYVEDASDSEFEKEFKVQYGSGGLIQYYYRLCKIVNEEFDDFKPEGFKEWLESQTEEKTQVADQRLKELNNLIAGYIFDKFKDLYGEKLYLEKGVRDKDMKTKAFEKSQDDPIEKRLPLEAYLDLLDLKKIVDKKYNWNIFNPVFNIPLPDKPKQSKNLDWFDRINALRRVPAHNYLRYYSEEDLEFIDWIHTELQKRMQLEKSAVDTLKQEALSPMKQLQA